MTKTDTKALAEANNEAHPNANGDTTMLPQSHRIQKDYDPETGEVTAYAVKQEGFTLGEMHRIGTNLFSDIAMLYAASPQQQEYLARSLADQMHFMASNKSRQVTESLTEMIELEDKIGQGADSGNNQNKLNSLTYLQGFKEAEERDLKSAFKAAAQAFKEVTGKKWEPRVKASAPVLKSQAQRFAEMQQRRA
jgi:hypothetical protein